jgi:hypothetical protein
MERMMFTRIAAVALCLLVSCTGMVLAEAPEARANGKRLTLPPIPRFTYRIKFEMTYAGHVAIRIKDRAFQDVPAAGYRATLVIERADGNLGPFYLEPAGGNKLETTAPTSLPVDGVRVLRLHVPDGRTAEWRYDPASAVPATH